MQEPNGAPLAPAATSRLRKSATTRMPVSSANKAGFCNLQCVARARRTPGGDGGRFVHGNPGRHSTGVELQVTQQLLDQGCIDARRRCPRGRPVQLVRQKCFQGKQLAFELVEKGQIGAPVPGTFSSKVHQNSTSTPSSGCQTSVRCRSPMVVASGSGSFSPLAACRRG